MQRREQRLKMFRIARSKLTQTISSIKNVITIYLSVHVRWPARPQPVPTKEGEHRAGLEFSLLLSLLQGVTIYFLDHEKCMNYINFLKNHVNIHLGINLNFKD